MSISSNLERIRNEIADACARAHRSPSTVALMAVSKMHPAEAILEAHAAGQRLFGENRVQEWQSKISTLATSLQPGTNAVADLGAPLASFASKPSSAPPTDLKVHLIGPLQNNKTTKAAELFHGVDTLDSLKTAERLHRDRKSTRLNSSHLRTSRMPSSA